MTEKTLVFYLCPKCFLVQENPQEHHKKQMIKCDVSGLSEEQRKPLYTKDGQLVTRAPIWFLEEIGALPTEG